MNVAVVVWKLYPSFVGGTERQSRMLAYALANLGATVDVVCADVPPGDDSAALPFRILPVGWPKWVPNIVAEYFFSRRAARLMARGHYDVVYGQNLALWQSVRRQRGLCVMSPYGMEPLKTLGWWALVRGWLRRRAWRYTAQHANLVVSAGGKLTAEIERLLGVEPARIVEIPIAVDLRETDRFQTAAAATAKIPGTFLCVARLEYNKGVDLLIDAFRLLESRSAARLYVVGEGSMRGRLERAVPSNVTLLGHQSEEDLARWYRRAEALVLPSRYEALGTVILEAMAFGLPVIATDIGAVSTVVDQTNGLLVAPGSAPALAQAITAFQALPAETKTRMGTCSRARVEADFDWDRIGRQTLSVLSQFVAARAGGAAVTPC